MEKAIWCNKKYKPDNMSLIIPGWVLFCFVFCVRTNISFQIFSMKKLFKIHNPYDFIGTFDKRNE